MKGALEDLSLDGVVIADALSTYAAWRAAYPTRRSHRRPRGREAPDFFRDEMSAGILVVAETAEEILAALHRLLARGQVPVAASPRRAPAMLQRLLNGDLAPDSPASSLRPG